MTEGHWNRFRPPAGERPTVEVMDDIAPYIEGNTSLDLLQAIYRSADQPLHRRMRAAIAALPHEHPKLAVTAQLDGKSFAAELEAARNRSGQATVIRELSKPSDSGVTDPECTGDVG
jgi:hypothetical protein